MEPLRLANDGVSTEEQLRKVMLKAQMRLGNETFIAGLLASRISDVLTFASCIVMSPKYLLLAM